MSQVGNTTLGDSPLGDVPAADLQGAVRPYAEELEAANRTLFLAVELQSYDQSNGLTTTRVATSEFATEPDDTPANTIYEGRLGRSFTIQRRLPLTDDFYGGVVRPSFSEIEIDNVDGGLDSLLTRAVDGRVVTVRAGKSEAIASNAYRRRIDQSGIIAKARAAQWTGDGRTLRVPLTDITDQLNRPSQVEIYAGTGGVEGPETLKDRSKPILLGRGFNIAPTLINAGLNIYQVSIGPIQSIDAVRDAGLPLTDGVTQVSGGYDELAATSPEPGTYSVSLSTGLIRLGSPPAGIVTVDAKGVLLNEIILFSDLWEGSELWSDGTGWLSTATGPGYVETVAGCIRYLMVKALKWGRNVIDDGSFTLLDRSQNAPIGHYIPTGSSETVSQSIEAICTPLGIFTIPTRLGQAQLGRLEAPTGIAPLSLSEVEISSIERLPLPYRVPPYRYELVYAANDRIMSDSEFVAAVSLEDRQRFGFAGQQAAVESLDIRTRHITSEVRQIVTPLALEADAIEEANRLIALYSTDRMLIEVEVPILGVYTQIGREVEVTHRALGLEQGRNFRIVQCEEDAGRNITTVTLFG